MEYPHHLRIDYPISMLCTVEYPSFYPLNKDWVEARGSAFGRTQKVFIQIDENGWQEASGTVNWVYRFNTKGLGEGPHTFCIQLFDGKSRSGILRKIFIVRDSGRRSDLESIEAAALHAHRHGWLEDGRFAGGASPSFPFESVHMGLAPFVIGTIYLYRITGKEAYKDYTFKGMKRLMEKQLPNGGILTDIVSDEEPLDTALAGYCFELSCQNFPEQVIFRETADRVVQRILSLMQSKPFQFWYPYALGTKKPFHVRYSYGQVRNLFEKILWWTSPDVSFYLHELLGRWRSSMPIPNFQARALAVLAKAYHRTRDERIKETLLKGLEKFFSWVPENGAIRYCRKDPSIYLYYIAWSIEPVLEVLTILREHNEYFPAYEKLTEAAVQYLQPHLRAITDSSIRFFFDDCCKLHRLQGGGQGSTLCLWDAISMMTRYFRYFQKKNDSVRHMVNYAKTLQKQDGSFPVDETDQTESSLWGTTTYLRNAALALAEGALN
jgi:hypothetical protein